MFDDESGYDLDDPKHPTFYERYAGIWDNRDKTRGGYIDKGPDGKYLREEDEDVDA